MEGEHHDDQSEGVHVIMEGNIMTTNQNAL